MSNSRTTIGNLELSTVPERPTRGLSGNSHQRRTKRRESKKLAFRERLKAAKS
jgi:hypothetical protein